MPAAATKSTSVTRAALPASLSQSNWNLAPTNRDLTQSNRAGVPNPLSRPTPSVNSCVATGVNSCVATGVNSCVATGVNSCVATGVAFDAGEGSPP
jgi:hypothetical protein